MLGWDEDDRMPVAEFALGSRNRIPMSAKAANA